MEEQKLQDILEIVTFIKDNGATKQDLQDVRTEFKQEIKEVRDELQQTQTDLEQSIQQTRNEMIDHVDGFIGLHRKQEVEIAAMAMHQKRTDKKVEKIIKHLNLDLV
ncbi:MAG: hypothetical protein GW939_04085 [Candidatus Magasanikbacteria bacterium]|nr:hypothetical protein [Candidatus Magasanikbacteria bacterium]